MGTKRQRATRQTSGADVNRAGTIDPSHTSLKTQQLLKWRTARIDRFRSRQLSERRWISFADIADWCARESGSIRPDEAKAADAYAGLLSAMRKGEFEVGGQSRVLFLHPRTKIAKLDLERIQFQIEVYGDDTRPIKTEAAFRWGPIVADFLADCWIPVEFCRAWFAARRITTLPPWLEQPKSDSNALPYRAGSSGKQLVDAEFERRPDARKLTSNVSAETKRTKQAGNPPLKGGRLPKADWDGFVKKELFALLDENGAPDPSDPGWRCQADAERAVAKIVDDTFAPSTIRFHTKRLIAQWKEEKVEKGR